MLNLKKQKTLGFIFVYIPDIVLSIYIAFILINFNNNPKNLLFYAISMVVLFITIRTITIILGRKFFYKNRINIIKELISEFKKGKFVTGNQEIKGDDELADVINELLIVGRHLDNIVSSQKDEIDKYQELYDSIVLSISSYFIVLNDNEIIKFANEGFCKKFGFDVAEITGKRVDDIFYFVNAKLKSAISQTKEVGKSVILEKTHLLSVNKISIIADVKISNINVQGRNQIIIIIDDVTNRLRKDYQISLMSQISESIQRDVEIERVLYTILTGVTSGSGLGFNRAMLFLVENETTLIGKMAVGPDSFEEAIEIWSSVSSSGSLIEEMENVEKRSGRELLKKVLGARFTLNEDNLFIKTLHDKTYTHIYDSWNDERVSAEMRSFMDVKEFVIVPLIIGNKSIGVITADNKFNQTQIGNDSIELLSLFASQAAFSIESYNSLESVKYEMEKIRSRQDAIVESEKMAAVGRIASHIAHEIRNPLVTMGGYARRIIQLSKEKSEKIQKSANIILKESERLEKILSNVMDFTRPSKYIREFNSVNDVINDTVELLHNLFQEKKITIEMKLKEDLPLVKSDFNQMKQVVLNLLQNSIDATPSEGSVEIITYSTNKHVILKVADTGGGINENDANIVFEPFFTTKVTGVGLGLANVKKIIKDHSGEITVKNKKDGGVQFTIKLPIPN